MRRFLPALLALFLAASAFAETPEEEAGRYLQTLISSVREKNDPMRNRMFMKLRVLGNPSVGPLLTALQDPSPEVRHYVAFTLGFFDDARVPAPLLSLFGSDGEVYYCKNSPSVGNARNRSAEEIYFDPGNLALRAKSLLRETCPACPPNTMIKMEAEKDLWKLLGFWLRRPGRKA